MANRQENPATPGTLALKLREWVKQAEKSALTEACTALGVGAMPRGLEVMRWGGFVLFGAPKGYFDSYGSSTLLTYRYLRTLLVEPYRRPNCTGYTTYRKP